MGGVEQHTLRSKSLVHSCTAHQSCFQNLLLRCHFLRVLCEEVEENLDGSRLALGVRQSASMSCYICHNLHTFPQQRHGDTHSNISTYISIATTSLLDCLVPYKSGMTPSGHLAETHGLTRYEPNLTNSQRMVACTESQNPHGAGCGPISSILPSRSTTKFHRGSNRSQLIGSKEQLKNMSKPLVMKFLLRSHQLPKCVERNCGK